MPERALPFPPMPLGTTRVASIGALPDVLARLGQPLPPLLDAVGLPATLFEDHDRPVEVARAAALLALAAERSGCPHIGLLCGATYRPETLGLAGLLCRNARDVGSALRGLALNLHLNGHTFVPSLTVTGDTAEFGLRLLTDVPHDRYVVDVGMAGAFAIVRALCGPGWSPLEVTLVHGADGRRSAYDRYYCLPVRLGSDRNGIVFAASWLTRKVHGANAASLLLFERELATISRRHPMLPAVATRRALLACIARGDVSVRGVAAALGLHAQTLNRRLAAEGTSVFALTKEVRYQVARDLLANTTLAVTEIAATLVYADSAAFTRAFRQWAGTNPLAWRRTHGRRPSRR